MEEAGYRRISLSEIMYRYTRLYNFINRTAVSNIDVLSLL